MKGRIDDRCTVDDPAAVRASCRGPLIVCTVRLLLLSCQSSTLNANNLNDLNDPTTQLANRDPADTTATGQATMMDVPYTKADAEAKGRAVGESIGGGIRSATESAITAGQTAGHAIVDGISSVTHKISDAMANKTEAEKRAEGTQTDLEPGTVRERRV
jgi:hypothetical protein